VTSEDSISFTSLIVAVMRLGLTPFPISTRNSPAAIAHLVKKTHVIQMFVSPDPAMQRLWAESRDLLRGDGFEVEALPMVQFTDISDEGTAIASCESSITCRKRELDNVACFLHSSGEWAISTHANYATWLVGCGTYWTSIHSFESPTYIWSASTMLTIFSRIHILS